MRNKFQTSDSHQTVVAAPALIESSPYTLDSSLKRCLQSLLHFIILSTDSLVHDPAIKSNT